MRVDELIQSVGTGPDLVMLHGWAAHSGVWGRFADCLSTRFRLHLVDLPGHGSLRDTDSGINFESFSASIQERFPGADWLGWSLGGLLTMKAALAAPEKTGKLVLLCSSACFLEKNHWPGGMTVTDFDAFRAGIERDQEVTLKRFIALHTQGSDKASQVRQVLGQCLDSAPPSKEALFAGLDILAATDLSGRLEGLNNPVLLISGQHDQIVSANSVVQTANLIPGARHHVVISAGHAPFISHAEELCGLVGDFLRPEGQP